MSASDDILANLWSRARRRPEDVAFLWDGGDFVTQISYGALAGRVRAFGDALASLGVEPGDKVAICMENRIAWPVSFLGVWYAGGVAVPLDTQQDPGALGRMLRHSDAGWCVTSLELQEKASAARDDGAPDVVLLSVDVEGAELPWDGTVREGRLDRTDGPAELTAAPVAEAARARDVEEPDAWDPRPSPDGLGVIMYTSGTTGRPKGVMLTRASLVENIVAALPRLDVDADDQILSVLPLFHVLPLMANCLGPLHLGATVTFLSRLTSDRILEAFDRHRITVFVCVPLFFYRFHERVRERIAGRAAPVRWGIEGLQALSGLLRRTVGWNVGRRLFPAIHEPFGPTLRLLLTGGAKMNPEVYEDFLDWGFVLAQGYGLTEATAALTLSPLDDVRPDTVGPPLENVELRIHDPDEGGVGEIWARGPTIMRGYYKDPEATDVVVVDGWLRTGDVGRLVAGDHLQVTGRAKDVIVLASGKNVHPEDLEPLYEEGELVEEICVLGVDDPSRQGAERLHGIVVPDVDEARRRGYVNVREMVRWQIQDIASSLPSPQRLHSLEFRTEPLPRTTTRKVQRYRLKQEVEAVGAAGEKLGEERDRETEAAVGEATTSGGPETPWQREVHEIVARRAGVESVSAADHVDLDLGMESLDRLELVVELEERFGISIPEGAAGRVQTVGDLVDELDALIEEGAVGSGGPAGDRWSTVLARIPDGVEPYLKRRPITEFVCWVLLRGLRLVYRAVAGFYDRGRERLPGEYPYLICPNHFSYLDSFVVAASLPRRVLKRAFFVGYSEYFSGPLGRAVARWLRVVPIDQNLHLERALQAAATGLRRGFVLIVFPEGGRSADDRVQEFRRGAEILARELELSAVPVGIWGTHQAWPRGGRFHRHPVAVVFGEAMAAEGTDAASTESPGGFSERLRRRVVQLVEEGRRELRPGTGAEERPRAEEDRG